MTIFKNVFGNCFSNSNDSHDECIEKINKLEMRINIIESGTLINMKRIEDKIDIKFDMMNQKVDSILMLMRNSK